MFPWPLQFPFGAPGPGGPPGSNRFGAGWSGVSGLRESFLGVSAIGIALPDGLLWGSFPVVLRALSTYSITDYGA